MPTSTLPDPGSTALRTYPAVATEQRSRARGNPSGTLPFILADVAAIFLTCLLAYVLRHASPAFTVESIQRSLESFSANGYFGVAGLYAALVVVACRRNGLYGRVPIDSKLDEALAVAKSVFFASIVLMAFLYLARNQVISRLTVVTAGVLTVSALLLVRRWRALALERSIAAGIGVRNVVIIGAGRVGRALEAHLNAHPNLGYVVKGFLDHHDNGHPRMLGPIDRLPEIARSHFVDEVFITIPSEKNLVKQLALEAPTHNLELKVIPELFDGIGWHAPVEYVGDFPVMALHRRPSRRLELLAKRVIDVFAAVLGLLLLSPFLLLIALAIKLDSRGPAFYGATRVGRKGRTFKCWKFRTMVAEAEQMLDRLLHLNERQGVLFKISKDPRVTRLGRLLRKYSLDELPQLFNVLTGEMSLVGPRPPTVGEYERYKLEHLRRLEVTPGITGLWQVTCRQDPSFESYLQRDVEYIENWSLWMDFKILVRTLPVVVKGTGV